MTEDTKKLAVTGPEAVPLIERMLATAQAAGGLAMVWKYRQEAYFETHGCLPSEEKAGDKSPVTDADKQVNIFIREELRQLTPDIPVVAEENTPEENRQALEKGKGTYWCVDPIDGTSNFIRGSHRWGVLIGLVQDGLPVLGVAYYPEMQQIYYTNEEGKAIRGISWQKMRGRFSSEGREDYMALSDIGKGLPLRVDRRFIDHHYNAQGLRSGIRSVFLQGREGEIPPQRELMAARGEYDISFLPKLPERETPCIWDAAAPMAILRAAGGEVFLHDGTGRDVRKLEAGEDSVFTRPPENLRMPPFMTGNEARLEYEGLLSPHQRETGSGSPGRGR